jgi:hypothetical protein
MCLVGTVLLYAMFIPWALKNGLDMRLLLDQATPPIAMPGHAPRAAVLQITGNPSMLPQRRTVPLISRTADDLKD